MEYEKVRQVCPLTASRNWGARLLCDDCHLLLRAPAEVSRGAPGADERARFLLVAALLDLLPEQLTHLQVTHHAILLPQDLHSSPSGRTALQQSVPVPILYS